MNFEIYLKSDTDLTTYFFLIVFVFLWDCFLSLFEALYIKICNFLIVNINFLLKYFFLSAWSAHCQVWYCWMQFVLFFVYAYVCWDEKRNNVQIWLVTVLYKDSGFGKWFAILCKKTFEYLLHHRKRNEMTSINFFLSSKYLM